MQNVVFHHLQKNSAIYSNIEHYDKKGQIITYRGVEMMYNKRYGLTSKNES